MRHSPVRGVEDRSGKKWLEGVQAMYVSRSKPPISSLNLPVLPIITDVST
jgi:hypothetical protein